MQSLRNKSDMKLSAKDVYLLKLYRKLKDTRMRLIGKDIRKLLSRIKQKKNQNGANSLSLKELSEIEGGTGNLQLKGSCSSNINDELNLLGKGNNLVGSSASRDFPPASLKDSDPNIQFNNEVIPDRNDMESAISNIHENNLHSDSSEQALNTVIAEDDVTEINYEKASMSYKDTNNDPYSLETLAARDKGTEAFEDQVQRAFSPNGDVYEMSTTSEGRVTTVTWNIANITPQKIEEISPEVFSDFEQMQFEQLNPSCVAVMTAEQFDSLPIAAFDKEPKDFGIEQWEYAPETIAELTPDQMEVFTSEATEAFKAELLSELTVDTFETFTTEQISSLFKKVEHSMSQEVFNLLPDSDIGLKNLNLDQFLNDDISENMLDKIQAQILPNLTPQMADLFEPSQIATLGANVDLLPKDFLNALDKDQLAALGKN